MVQQKQTQCTKGYQNLLGTVHCKSTTIIGVNSFVLLNSPKCATLLKKYNSRPSKDKRSFTLSRHQDAEVHGVVNTQLQAINVTGLSNAASHY